MATKTLFLVLASFPLLLNGYNVAIFAPDISNSQLIFNNRVAKTLTNAGHNVTIFIIQNFESPPPKIKFSPAVNVELVNGSSGHFIDEYVKDMLDVTYYDIPVWDRRQRERFAIFEEMARACQQLVQNASFLEYVESKKFDIAFTHVYTYCNIGIIHKTKIPSWVWLLSTAMAENVADAIGVPSPPSFCTPMMMDAGENLTFFERIKSLIGQSVTTPLMKMKVTDVETAIFRKQFGDFPDLFELSKKCPLVMVNSNELYDFAKPTLSKVVNIGGIGLDIAAPKTLPTEYTTLVESSKGFVVMTFGSFAPMHLMPESWKSSFAHVFSSFPDVRFFVRYENIEDTWSKSLPKNVFLSNWLPQSDLLSHNKCLGLISHGGYNSLQDALHAGIPVLTIPLFGDQPRNGHLVEKLGMGINVRKAQVGDKSQLLSAMKRLIGDNKLHATARRFRSMIAKRPVSSEQLLVKWTEFAAEFHALENLIPFSINLNPFVYHSLDVIIFMVLVASSTIYVFYRFLRCLCCKSLHKEKAE